MKSKNYTLEALIKDGYSIIDNQINVHNDKLFVSVKAPDGNILSAYLSPRNYDDITMPEGPIPFTNEWGLVHRIKEPTDDAKTQSHFLLVKNKVRVHPIIIPKHLPRELPVTVGTYIHRKSIQGTYLVVYANHDILVITSKPWAKLFIKGERESPNEVILWDDYKVNQGVPTENKQ